jgi:hypothetical protein
MSSLPATIPQAILDTVLGGLAALFLTGAGGDITAARQAAAHMLAAYRPETQDELRLAAAIVGFSFHALEALGQAAAPDLPFTRILRLRGSAVSLSREAAKAERRLLQLRKARVQDQPAETRSEPAQPEPPADKARVEHLGPVAVAAKASGLTWTQSYEHRQQDIRLAASLKRAEAWAAERAKAAPAVTDRGSAMAPAI